MADGSPIWKDPEIAGVRALLAGFATPPGSPEPTFEARRSGMDAFGEMSPLPIEEPERRFRWPAPGRRPPDHPGLRELGL